MKPCASIGAAKKGEKLHDEIARQGFLENDVGTNLVDMYAKCGALVKSQQLLEKLSIQNAFSWNTLIAGYAQLAQIKEAIDCLEHMQLKGVSPNFATFICILKACGNIGAIHSGAQVHDRIAGYA